MANLVNSINGNAYNYNMKTTVKPKALHILQMNAQEKREFLDSFDLVLSDCDGVVWMLVDPLPNTGSAIMHFKNAGKQFKFISNNSVRTDEEYLSKLKNIGVADVRETDLVHPVKTILRYIEKNKLRQPLYSLCSREVNKVLVEKGIQLITLDSPTNLKPADLIPQVKPTDKVGGVIVDLNINLTFAEMARAQQYLQAKDCPLIVGASDFLMPVSKNFVTIGPGGFIEILRMASGKEPVILGKPGALLGEDLIELFGLKNKRHRALFIGDSVHSDIKFAKSCGFQALFVLSGACSMEDMLQLPEASKPDYIADGLADFNEFFETL